MKFLLHSLPIFYKITFFVFNRISLYSNHPSSPPRYGGCTSTCGGPRASSYRLRALLWAAGLSASNKVLECLCARHARGATLAHDDLVVALARLHLAHGEESLEMLLLSY